MENSKFKYKFTLFTPCYCSAKYIDRIKETLDNQTYRDFEWIVVNDASPDNTSEVIEEYIKTVDFPVKFFDLKTNQMLAANYNLAAKNSEGEIFVVLGHDDVYMPDMLENYAHYYDLYDSPEVCGLVGRCVTQYGKVTPTSVFSKPLMNYWEYGVDKNGIYTGEAPRALKTDVLRKYMPFNEEEKLNPPIEELMSCDGYKFITVDKIVRKYFVSENSGALSYNLKKFRLHGWKRAVLTINRFQFFANFSLKRKIRMYIDTSYSAIMAGIGFRAVLKEIHHNKFEVILFYPLGLILSFIANNGILHNLFLYVTTGRRPPKETSKSQIK